MELIMLTARDLFIFKNAGRDLPAVDEWLDGEPRTLFAIARTWFNRMRDCGDDVDVVMHDGCPTACINGAAFGYVNVFKTHVNVGFFSGAFLTDPAGLLEGTGRRMRHVKVFPGEDFDERALGKLIEDAYLHVQSILKNS